MPDVQLADKVFEPFITADQIAQAVNKIASHIVSDYKDSKVLFISVLNGSAIFAADLLRALPPDFNCELTFLRVASYSGTQSTGQLTELLGLNRDVTNAKIIVLEDIVDSGLTAFSIIKKLKEQGAKSVQLASLLYKPENLAKQITIDYIGIEIENKFVVGYGLDYLELGRNLKDIYILKNQ